MQSRVTTANRRPRAYESHDARGAWVTTLVDGVRPAGRQTVTSDGRDAAGRRVASGVYFVRLESSGRIETQRVVTAK